MKKWFEGYFCCKKLFFLIIFFLLVLLVNVNLIKASSGEEAGLFVRGIGEWIVEVFSIFFSIETENPIDILAMIFISLILFLIIYMSISFMNLFEERKIIKVLFCFAITSIVILSLKEDLLIFLLGYSLLGIFMLTFVPLVVVFWFSLKLKSVALARITWFFFAFFYIVLYFYNLNNLEKAPVSYLVFGIIGLFMIFLVAYAREKLQKELTEITIDRIKENSELKAIKAKA
jgi:hypothetical protein